MASPGTANITGISVQNARAAGTDAWRRALLAVMAAAALVVAPGLFLGNASGHDFIFHIESWTEVAKQWHEGVIYPRWAAWANYGYGEPRFIFYPPLSWLLGAGLGSVLPWKLVPGTFVWLVMIGAGAAMFHLAREWLCATDATLAAIFYAVNPYHLVTFYYRSDFSELMASAMLPLLVLAAIRIGRQGWRVATPFALVFAVIWLANAPAAVLASYSAVLLLVILCLMRRNVRPLTAGSAAIAVGFGLAAFYIVPAACERRWVDIGQVLSNELRPEQNFLFTQANDPEFVFFNWKVSGVALAFMLMTGIAGVLAARQRRRLPEMWWPLSVLAGVAVLMMFPFTASAWKHLPELRFVQFPWRWLSPLAVSCSIFLTCAIGQARRKRRWWAVIGLVVAALAGVMASDAWWDSEDIPAVLAAVHSGQGYEGTDEYVPLGCNRYDLPQKGPRVAAMNSDEEMLGREQGVRMHIELWAPEKKSVSIHSPQPIVLAMRVVNYPAWEARINGIKTSLSEESGTRQMLLPVPKGTSRVEVRFRRTGDRVVGDAISLVTLGAILAFALTLRRRGGTLPDLPAR